MTIITRLKKLEKATRPLHIDLASHVHIVEQGESETKELAIRKYEMASGKIVNSQDLVVVLISNGTREIN